MKLLGVYNDLGDKSFKGNILKIHLRLHARSIKSKTLLLLTKDMLELC